MGAFKNLQIMLDEMGDDDAMTREDYETARAEHFYDVLNKAGMICPGCDCEKKKEQALCEFCQSQLEDKKL